MPQPQKPHKLVQVKVNVGSDVDIQKLIGQVHTFVAKSKMNDRIEIHINGQVSNAQPDAGDDVDLSLL